MLEIINKKRGKSIVILTGNTSTAINLSHLSTNTAIENVTAASISRVFASGTALWKVYRGDDATGDSILELAQNANWPLIDYDIAISTNATSNIYLTNTGTAGTIILVLSKEATYSPALTDF